MPKIFTQILPIISTNISEVMTFSKKKIKVSLCTAIIQITTGIQD